MYSAAGGVQGHSYRETKVYHSGDRREHGHMKPRTVPKVPGHLYPIETNVSVEVREAV